MRMIAFACLAVLSLAPLAEAAGLAESPARPRQQSDVIEVQNFNSRSAPTNQNNGSNRRREQFVCVITPPDSAERSRPYVCPVQQGRVGGRCRCSGVVGSGTVDTAW